MLSQYNQVISMVQPECAPEWLSNAPNFIYWDAKAPADIGLEETIIARDLVK